MKVDYCSRELPLKRPFGFWDLESMTQMSVQVDGIEFALVEIQDERLADQWFLVSEGEALSNYPKGFKYSLEDWGYQLVHLLSNRWRTLLETESQNEGA